MNTLAPYLSSADAVATISLYYDSPNGTIEEWDTTILKKIITALCKKHRTWNYDSAITLPTRDRTSKSWMLCTTVVALAKRGTVFTRPESLVVASSSDPPFLLGRKWLFQPPTKANLARAICRAIRYPTPLLYARGVGNYEFQILAELPKRVRLAFHGVPRNTTKAR